MFLDVHNHCGVRTLACSVHTHVNATFGAQCHLVFVHERLEEPMFDQALISKASVHTSVNAARKSACASVPSMGRISLNERSQPEPMTATVAKRKA
jgi:hypothetical protein